MTTDQQAGAVARGLLESLQENSIVLAVPGSSYRLKLALNGSSSAISTPVGKRIKGTIEARALRVHPARAGGKFVEPVWGEPRIVQGMVKGREHNRLLVDVSVPMWVTLDERQNPAEFPNGQMVNFYVESGTTFTPA